MGYQLSLRAFWGGIDMFVLTLRGRLDHDWLLVPIDTASVAILPFVDEHALPLCHD